MDLKHLDKTIIAAVAQRPFLNRNSYGVTNTFCKLVPLFDPRDEYEEILSENDFYNDGEIWWKVSSSNFTRRIVPGTLVEVRLERSKDADEQDPDKSLYQVDINYVVEDVLGSKCGAEIFQLNGETEDALSRFKGAGNRIDLGHVPSRLVFFRVAGFVYGPFATELAEAEAEGCRANVLVKPFRADLKVFKIASEGFDRTYQVLETTKDISLDQVSRYDSGNTATISWAYIPAAEYAKAEGDFTTAWQEMDFEPLSAKLAKIIRSLEGFTRSDKKQVRAVVERLELAVTQAEDPNKIREAISGINSLAEDAEQNVKEIARLLLENGLLGEDRLKEAEKAYLDQWIGTQSEQINAAIEAKQRELDELTQKVSEENAQFEFNKKRREKELQDKEEKARAKIDELRQEEISKINSEKANWNEERSKLKSEFDDKEAKIEAMLRAIQGATEEQAAEVIRLYPFLGRGARVDGVESKPADSAPQSATSESFPIPTILKGGCRGAKITADQTIFIKQLSDHARSQGFYYDSSDLRRFHTSVLCEGLTVLAGPSGVGKSSLARLYGEVLSGGEDDPRNGTHVIHVSPTWMERSDILGYVNTVTGEFSPSETGLYQRLIYAAEDYKTNGGDAALYPICLDEMNLSQIEHYFNDFMQLLEQRERERILPCFSPEAVGKNSVFKQYARIQLAPTLRFIGTVNFDETTRRMSMRLLDRVNLIHLSDTSPSRLPGKKNGQNMVRGVSYETYSSWIKSENLSPAAEKCLQDLDPHLRHLGTTVSPRVREGMKKYIASAKPLIEEGSPELVAFDEQIAQRVLSKIRSLTSERQEDALGEVERILSDYCGSAMTQSRRMIDALREQGRPFGFQREDED